MTREPLFAKRILGEFHRWGVFECHKNGNRRFLNDVAVGVSRPS